MFEKKLIQLRKDHKYTQSEVAKAIGISTRQYGYIERGHFTLNYQQLIKLCKLYQITADNLLGISAKIVYPDTSIEN